MKPGDLERLNEAINQGILEVEYSDRRVKYRSLDEMLRIKNLLEQELGAVKKMETIKLDFKSTY